MYQIYSLLYQFSHYLNSLLISLNNQSLIVMIIFQNLPQILQTHYFDYLSLIQQQALQVIVFYHEFHY